MSLLGMRWSNLSGCAIYRASLLSCLIPCILLGVMQASRAQDKAENDWQVLQQIQQAAQRLNYSGVFTYQMGSRMHASRITHWTDGRDTREKLEMLDGKPNEIIRHNDVIQHFFPEQRRIVQEKRQHRDSFPAISAALNPEMSQYYQLKRLSDERVAGMDCIVHSVESKDRLRYGYRFWSEKNSALLLKTQTLNEQGEVVEQVAFNEVLISPRMERQRLKPSYTDIAQWQQEQVQLQPANLQADGWLIRWKPAGFRAVHELKRLLPVSDESGVAQEMGQIVLSDGLAAISIFIQKQSDLKKAPAHAAHQGAINIVSRRIADFWVTVLGEVPANTVKQIAQSLDFKPEQKLSR